MVPQQCISLRDTTKLHRSVDTYPQQCIGLRETTKRHSVVLTKAMYRCTGYDKTAQCGTPKAMYRPTRYYKTLHSVVPQRCIKAHAKRQNATSLAVTLPARTQPTSARADSLNATWPSCLRPLSFLPITSVNYHFVWHRHSLLQPPQSFHTRAAKTLTCPCAPCVHFARAPSGAASQKRREIKKSLAVNTCLHHMVTAYGI